jgi:hypothetical protein
LRNDHPDLVLCRFGGANLPSSPTLTAALAHHEPEMSAIAQTAQINDIFFARMLLR